MNESKFLEVAKKAAIEAGKIIQKYSGQAYKKNIKYGDLSNFATDADLEAEKKIVEILTKNFPDHSIVAEEKGWSAQKSEFIWMVDPLDGTITFAQNIPYYTVSIGLLKNGKPIVGVINHISFKHLYWAKSGEGAFLNNKKICVSKKTKLEESVGTLDFGHRQKRSPRLDLYINKLITKIGYPYGFGSAAVGMALTADSTLDFYINQAYPWDFAAGTVIVREAGGKVTDFQGNEPDWTKERLEIVASNGLIHDAILEALK
ncbi:inositol monophosphatase [Patescibacteria group bacterium]|nr:inositol monophosphatase [Patescibacteria group bacterium]